ncbi:MAG: IS1-like element transposase [Symbiopectobacterium sp.]
MTEQLIDLAMNNIDLAMNNAGIRDTARELHISINAVVRILKNARCRMQQRCHWITYKFN